METAPAAKKKAGFFDRLMARFSQAKANEAEKITLTQEIHLMEDQVEVPLHDGPIQLILGKGRKGKTLWLYPELLLDPELSAETRRYLIIDPDRYFSEPSGFFRLDDGDSIVLGRGDETQQLYFHFPRTVDLRHLTIAHTGDSIIFKDITERAGSYIKPLGESLEEERAVSQRIGALARLREIYGGKFVPLPPDEALDLLRQVNEILETEGSRPQDDRGLPGGMVIPPEGLAPLVLGDLHGQVDNLLKVLTENHFLEGLENGTLCLFLLGDAVHSEIDGEMEEMESSLLMMDFIFKLKVRFPAQIFYLRGNHDSFSEEVGKGGVPQGLLWKREASTKRGPEYKEEMDRFYRDLPYCARSESFVTCHAGPPKTKVNQDLLVNIYKYPGIIREMVWNRLRRPNYPAGYTKGDVQRFRAAVNVGPETPFIVAHNPLSRDVSVWMDVGDIQNHHIVFSGMTNQVSIFFRIRGKMVPMVYTTEPLVDLINRI